MNQGKEFITGLEERLSGRSSGLRSLIRRRMFKLSAATAEALARIIEISVALIVTLAITFPVLLVLLFRKFFTGAPLFTSRAIVGARAKSLRVLRFNSVAPPLSRSSSLF